MRVMTIGAVFNHWRMLPEKWSASFGMAAITIFIDAGLLELGGIGRAMGVVAVRTGNLPFPQRHVRGTHQLRLALQMALTAYLGLRALVKKRRLVGDLGELVTIGGFFHQSMAVDAGNAPARMLACLPVGLHAPLMTPEACRVLHLGGLARVFTESDHAAGTLAAAGGNMVAAGTVTVLTGLLLHGVARIVEKNLAHFRRRKFFEGGSMASLAHFGADVGGGN